MAKRPPVWLLLADSKRARLLRAWSTRHARAHVEAEADLGFEFAVGEHGRPSPRVNKNGHSYAGRSHEQEEMLSQFARQVAAFAEAKVGELEVPRLHLFAAPKFLGALRKSLGVRLGDRLVEHDQELTHLSEARLAAHPEIVRLLET